MHSIVLLVLNISPCLNYLFIIIFFFTKLGIMLKFIFGKSRMDYSVSPHTEKQNGRYDISVPSHFKVFFVIIVGCNSCEKALLPLSSETQAERTFDDGTTAITVTKRGRRVGIVQNHKLSCCFC